jgi:uncharacterized protein YcbX
MTAPRIAALYTYPIKSCAGILVDTMDFDALGPLDDRRWMLVDEQNEFLTQRELPKLALVWPARVEGGLHVLAPGMPALRIAGEGGDRRTTHCWDDRCAGFDEGPAARAWFSEYLGRPVRLLRFDASAPRAASRNWVGEAAGRPGALTRFSDGYPLLVVSRGSLSALNVRLAAVGLPVAKVQRFRPNVVLEGIDEFEEDFADTISTVPLAGPAVVMKVVKPCTRCTIPEVDPATGRHAEGILRVLAGFRSDPKLGGAVTFGQNCVITGGLDGKIRVGDPVSIDYRL